MTHHLLALSARRLQYLRALCTQSGYCDPYAIGYEHGYTDAEMDHMLAAFDTADWLVWDGYGSGMLRVRIDLCERLAGE
jgi:hypothetical protein